MEHQNNSHPSSMTLDLSPSAASSSSSTSYDTATKRSYKILTRSAIHDQCQYDTNSTSAVSQNNIQHLTNTRANRPNSTCLDASQLTQLNNNELVLYDNGKRYSDSMDAEDQENEHAQWSQLPQELLTKIFGYLTIYDTEAVDATCVAWNQACNVPSLWRRVTFNFDGNDSIRLMTEALRLITSKGHFMRDLVLTIGSPGLNQAWMMSGCIQQLLDFICQSPCHSIETFRINNLVIFTQNRFFKLSKESILNSLNNFLRTQKNLKAVSFSACKFTPGEGLKILRTLKCFRSSLKTLELHDFFKRRYVSASKAFKIISSFTFLQDVSLDADYINDKMLMWLVEKWPNRKPLRHLKIYFEVLSPPPNTVSKECWMAARQCFQEMKVSYHIEGILQYQWMCPFLIPAVPLVECVIYWNHFKRHPMHFYDQHLTNIINAIACKQSTCLERFSLYSDVRSFPELEDALVSLVSSCSKLTDVCLRVNLLSTCATESISTILGFRTRSVTFQFQTTAPTGNRSRGFRNRGR